MPIQLEDHTLSRTGFNTLLAAGSAVFVSFGINGRVTLRAGSSPLTQTGLNTPARFAWAASGDVKSES